MSKEGKNKLQSKKQEYDRRFHRITIRYKPKEYADLKDLANKLGYDVTNYIKFTSLKPRRIPPRKPDQLMLSVKAEINKVGVDINQISRSLNQNYASKSFNKFFNEVANLREDLQRIYKEVGR